MNIIIKTLVFCIVLFIYLHIFFQLKTSNDLEIYEIEQPSKDTLEEICDLRQPVIFDFNNERLNETCNLNTVVNSYGAFDVKVRNLNNFDDQSELYIPITLKATTQLFDKDNEKKYITENNQDFLEETGLIKCYRYNDAFLRPYMVSECEYDFISATEQITTPFKYEINYRNYYLITQGSVKIKLAPPKNNKYLYPKNDYENFEFSSPVNPWNVQQQYKPDFDKIKCLEIVLKPGSMLFIPSFWWHSFQFSDKTSLCTFKYRTYMNTLANMPRFIMKFLQSQNVKRNVVKQFDNSKSNNIICNSNDNNSNDNTEKNLVNNVDINQLASVDNNLDNNVEINQLTSVDNNPNTSLISK